MSSIIGRTLINRQLPGKREILGSIGRGVKSFIKNPIKATKQGIANDRAARGIYKAATGKTRRHVVGAIAKGVYKGGGKDLAVNIGGAAGSAVGASGGKVGQLAGDWAGAAVTRKALDGTEALSKAARIRKNPAFQRQSPRVKAGIIAKRTKGYMKAGRKNFKKELKADTVGWGIGNSAAESLQSAGSKVPLQGGLIAMGTSGSAMKGLRVAKRVARNPNSGRTQIERIGTGVRKGVLTTNRNIGRNLNPVRKIRKGFNREQRMRTSINNNLRQLPRVPAGVSFKRRTYLSTFSKVKIRYPK